MYYDFPFLNDLLFFSRINKHLKNPCLVFYFADASLIHLPTSSLHSRALSHVHASGNVSLFWRLSSSCVPLAWNKLVILGLPFTAVSHFPLALSFAIFFALVVSWLLYSCTSFFFWWGLRKIQILFFSGGLLIGWWEQDIFQPQSYGVKVIAAQRNHSIGKPWPVPHQWHTEGKCLCQPEPTLTICVALGLHGRT